MNRRRFLTAAATLGTALTTLPSGRALLGADESNTSDVKGLVTGKYKLTPPAKGSIPVAILISEGVERDRLLRAVGRFRERLGPERD